MAEIYEESMKESFNSQISWETTRCWSFWTFFTLIYFGFCFTPLAICQDILFQWTQDERSRDGMWTPSVQIDIKSSFYGRQGNILSLLMIFCPFFPLAVLRLKQTLDTYYLDQWQPILRNENTVSTFSSHYIEVAETLSNKYFWP